MAATDLAGGSRFSGALPLPDLKGFRDKKAQGPRDPGTVVAVVAGRITGNNQLDESSLTVLNSADRTLEWEVPAGQWKLMVFWLEYTEQECSAQSFHPPAMVIDHMNQGAVQRYCEHLGGVIKKTVGEEFGRTVDSFFCDSFEFWPLSNALLWSTDTLEGFGKHTGCALPTNCCFSCSFATGDHPSRLQILLTSWDTWLTLIPGLIFSKRHLSFKTGIVSASSSKSCTSTRATSVTRSASATWPILTLRKHSLHLMKKTT